MKNVFLLFISIIAFAITLTSCKKKPITTVPNKQGTSSNVVTTQTVSAVSELQNGQTITLSTKTNSVLLVSLNNRSDGFVFDPYPKYASIIGCTQLQQIGTQNTWTVTALATGTTDIFFSAKSGTLSSDLYVLKINVVN